MTNSKKTPTAPLAHRVPTEVSATIQEYSTWLSAQTGVEIDPLSVYLGSQLRGTWQKSAERQSELAQAAKDRAARDAAKAKARAEREAAAAKKAAEPTPATPKAKTAPVAKAKPVRQRAAKPATPASTPVAEAVSE